MASEISVIIVNYNFCVVRVSFGDGMSISSPGFCGSMRVLSHFNLNFMELNNHGSTHHWGSLSHYGKMSQIPAD